MNKKNRYLKVQGKSDKLDSLNLLNLMYCNPAGDYGTVESLRGCWEKYRDGILAVWDELYPGTKPRPFWEFDCPKKPKIIPKKWDFGTFKDAYYATK